jgi:hypothetical protein
MLRWNASHAQLHRGGRVLAGASDVADYADHLAPLRIVAAVPGREALADGVFARPQRGREPFVDHDDAGTARRHVPRLK